MVCSYLLYSGQSAQMLFTALIHCRWIGALKAAADALNFFAERRTSEEGDREGVEAKSQERYVHYFQSVVYE